MNDSIVTQSPVPYVDQPRLTVLSQLAALASGAIDAEEQARTFLYQYERTRHLNAFISVAAEDLLAQARDHDRRRQQGQASGPLAGLLVCVKDNIHVAGFPNTAGTPSLRHFRPTADADVVAALRSGGALFAGKTNMHELALGITSANAAFGAVRNPAAPGKFAGGSSGGTAAAIAAGLVPAGLGTDTGGSIRIPAALCGIAGFRPTTTRYGCAGVTPVSRTRDTIGLMANTVSGIALLDGVITHRDQRIAPRTAATMRLGICSYFFAGIDREIKPVIDAALAGLTAAGVELVDVDMPDLGPLMELSAFPIAMYEVSRELRQYLVKYDTGIDFPMLLNAVASSDVKALLQLAAGEQVSAEAYAAALVARAQLAQHYQLAFAEHELTAMVMPTTPLPSRDIEHPLDTVDLNGVQVPTFPTYIRNTEPATIAALPSLTLPAGLTRHGLPVGLLLDGIDDRELLATGLQIEKVLSQA